MIDEAVQAMLGNTVQLPEVVRMEDLEAAIDKVVCDVYDSNEWGFSKWGVSKGELYRILKELPKYLATGLIKDS